MLEGLLLPDAVRSAAIKDDLRRVGRVERYINWVVRARPIRVEITQPRGTRVGVRVRHSGLADVVQRKVRPPACPRRPPRPSEDDAVRDLVRRDAGGEVFVQ